MKMCHFVPDVCVSKLSHMYSLMQKYHIYNPHDILDVKYLQKQLCDFKVQDITKEGYEHDL